MSLRGRLAVAATLMLAAACQQQHPPVPLQVPLDVARADFVGRERCAACHQAEATAWTGSHHDLAMAEADASTVLGDFGDTSFTDAAGVTTRFHRDGERYLATTLDGRGEERTFTLSHTFGWYPLQQYLVPMGDGRYQCLPVAWDTRPAESGGQRWFHVYGDEPIPPGDLLHWTGPQQNWNHMCADCHSTGLRKGYDPATDRFDTRWSEIDVSCEACHGPGSSHLEWVERGQDPQRTDRGFARPLGGAARGDWRFVAGEPTARPGPAARDNDRQIASCVPCHSRRSQLADHRPGTHPAESYRPDRLLPPMWHVDGQILDEDYVYHSFVQSKMYHAGVTCTDCHDAHRATLHAPADQLCARCHQQDHYARATHHHHAPGGEGASCVACHMPHRTYMQVDDRRDHRFGIPRPDLSLALGVPNACTGCHTGHDDAWAARHAREWWGEPVHDDRFARAIHAGTSGDPAAVDQLRTVAGDQSIPAIQRAAAIHLLLGLDPDPPRALLRAAAADPSPDLRLALVEALRAAPQVDPVPLAAPLLRDPHAAIRATAAASLVGHRVPARHQSALSSARELLEAAWHHNADRAEARTERALALQREGRIDAAEAELRRAIELDPARPAPWVNLADLRRARGDETGCRAILEAGIAALPDSGELHHALGLALVRDRRLDQALPALVRAAELRPDLDRFAYVLAVALDAAGRRAEAISVLEALLARNPGHREARSALDAWR